MFFWLKCFFPQFIEIKYRRNNFRTNVTTSSVFYIITLLLWNVTSMKVMQSKFLVLPIYQEHSKQFYFVSQSICITVIKAFQSCTRSNWGTEVVHTLFNITQSQYLSWLKPPHLNSSMTSMFPRICPPKQEKPPQWEALALYN